MAVDQNSGFPRNGRAFGPHDRMGITGQQFDLGTPQAPEVVPDPFGRPLAVRGMLGIGGNAGDSQERLELFEKARAFGQDECVDVGHAENIPAGG